MFDRILIPLDGSLPATAALKIGTDIAKRTKAGVHVLTLVESGPVRNPDIALIQRQAARYDANARVDVRPLSYSVPEDIAGEHDTDPNTLLVMQTWARGRSAGIVGNISEETLKLVRRPIVVVGPEADNRVNARRENGDDDRWLEGPMLIATDGSHFGDSAVPVAAELARQLSLAPELTTVIDQRAVPAGVGGGVAGEANSLVGLVDSVRSITGGEVNYDVLHNQDPAAAIVDHARSRRASFIAMSTHGRSGFDRITTDSVAMKVVRHAHCPVVLTRPSSAEQSARRS